MTSDDASARLLAEILADPARDAARLVYADHLLELGDPRGELVHAACKLEDLTWDDPARRPLERQVSDLLAVHETAWTRDVRALGFADHLHQVSLRRGFVERVTIAADQAPALVPALRAITPLREIHARLREVASIDAFGAAVADLEGISVATSNLEVTRALARSFVGWPQHGNLKMLHGTGPELARSIAAVPALRGLDRLRVSAASSGVGALAGARHLASVTTLELPHSGMGREGAEQLASTDTFTGLRRLQVEHARLDATAVRRLAEAPFARTLQQLRVHHNALGPLGVHALVARCPALELLDLEATELRAEGLVAVLGAPNLAHLRSLDLSHDGLGDDDLVAAVDRLALSALRHLACIGNQFEARAMAALGGAAGLADLRSLDLSSNPLGDAGVGALARSSTLTALEVLRLKSTAVGEPGMRLLAASELGSRLRTLDLGGNALDDAAVGALIAGRLAALDTLVLDGAALTARGVHSLVASPIAARLEYLAITGLEPGALESLLASDLPALRTLVADGLDDAGARVLASARGLPRLHTLVLKALGLTDAGAQLLAEAPGLEHLLWMELDAPGVGELGRAMLCHRFGHHVGVFAGASLHAFRALGRRV